MKKALLFAACALFLIFPTNEVFGQQAKQKPGNDQEKILALLAMTSEGWNKGDLNQYLSAYTKDATEMLSIRSGGRR